MSKQNTDSTGFVGPDKLPGLTHVGKYNGRNGYMTLKRLATERGILIEQGLFHELQELGYDLDPERDNKSRHIPGRLYEALARYGEGNERLTDFDERCFGIALNSVKWLFAGPFQDDLRPLALDGELISLLKQSSSAGAPSFLSRGEAFEEDLGLAKKVFADKMAPPPCVSFYRIQHGEKGEKERLVMAYPGAMTLGEFTFVKPLMERLIKRKSPYVAGLRRFEIQARMVRIGNKPVRYELDYSKFDSTQRAFIISKMFAILKENFVMDEDENRRWNKIVWYYIHTPVIMPDLQIWKKHRGTPSGSGFTQIIDTMINIFAILYSFLRMFNVMPDLENILAMGDDSLIGTSLYAPLDRFQQVLAEIGIRLNVEKSRISREYEPMHFLGHDWDHGVADRPVEETAKRLVFPERYQDVEERIRRNTKLVAYLTDSKSAWIVLEALSTYKGTYIPGYFTLEIAPLNITGWQELQATVYGERFDTPVVSGFLGLLL